MPVSDPGGGVSSWGGSAPGEGVVSQHALRQTLPRVNRITDTSKNITLATTSLRLVKIVIMTVQPIDIRHGEADPVLGNGTNLPAQIFVAIESRGFNSNIY